MLDALQACSCCATRPALMEQLVDFSFSVNLLVYLDFVAFFLRIIMRRIHYAMNYAYTFVYPS